jgi:hypothetical protein
MILGDKFAAYCQPYARGTNNTQADIPPPHSRFQGFDEKRIIFRSKAKAFMVPATCSVNGQDLNAKRQRQQCYPPRQQSIQIRVFNPLS